MPHAGDFQDSHAKLFFLNALILAEKRLEVVFRKIGEKGPPLPLLPRSGGKAKQEHIENIMTQVNGDRSPFSAKCNGLQAKTLLISTAPLKYRQESSLQIIVRDNNIDQALKALKKKMQREGIFREMKLRGHYEKPSEKRARERAEAIRRYRKLQRKRLQREGVLPK
jgi:small subunit ribosomal protein S21